MAKAFADIGALGERWFGTRGVGVVCAATSTTDYERRGIISLKDDAFGGKQGPSSGVLSSGFRVMLGGRSGRRSLRMRAPDTEEKP